MGGELGQGGSKSAPVGVAGGQGEGSRLLTDEAHLTGARDTN